MLIEGQTSDDSLALDTATSSTGDDVAPPSGILAKLLHPNDALVSKATLDCLEMLQYHKKNSFLLKDESQDLSAALSTVRHLVGQWQMAQREVSLTSNPARNLFEFQSNIKSRVSLSTSIPAVKLLFTRWGIRNVRSRSNTPAQPSIEDVGTTSTNLPVSNDAIAELEKEVDIIHNAMMYRHSKWMSTFPDEDPLNVQWPTSFTPEERKSMREFLRNQMNAEMWAESRSREDIHEDVAAIKESESFRDFPVPRGKAAMIICQILMDVRKRKSRADSCSQSRSQSESHGRSASRDSSRRASLASSTPVLSHKRQHSDIEDDEDDDEDDLVVLRSRSTRGGDMASPSRGRSLKRRGSPL